jgi:hypothetical protein
LTAQDVLRQAAIAKAAASSNKVLQGVSAQFDPAFSESITKGTQKVLNQYVPYEVEYIIGGSSDGSAKTFKIQIEDSKESPTKKN